MRVLGKIKPRKTEWVQQEVKAVDMTPFKYAKLTGLLLIAAVLAIFITFADFSSLEPFAQ